VKGSGKTVEGSGHGEERVGKGGSNEVAGVSLEEDTKASQYMLPLLIFRERKADIRKRFHPRGQSGW
jgi:hypothetical protein